MCRDCPSRDTGHNFGTVHGKTSTNHLGAGTVLRVTLVTTSGLFTEKLVQIT